MDAVINEIMGLVDAHGNACETFGDYQSAENAYTCAKTRAAIGARIRQVLQCQGCDVPKDGVYQISEPAAVQQGLEQFIEQAGDVHFQRCRFGSAKEAIRWDIEFGHYGAEVSGKTLQEAIAKALTAQAKQGEQP